MDKKYIETALTLARLYGIAETLHPWTYLNNEAFIKQTQRWTEEFLGSKEQDILAFFEGKISK